MKRIILPLFALFFTLSSYPQYRVFYFVDALKGKKSTVKKLLTNEVKKANQVRIDKGVLKGYDIWEIITVGGESHSYVLGQWDKSFFCFNFAKNHLDGIFKVNYVQIDFSQKFIKK